MEDSRMRILFARLKGYIGIYNGLGLDEISIDFKRCKHRIVVISGVNGCGKSTLMDALSILPDPPSIYRAGISGEKELIVDDNGIIYHILITCPIGKSGRGTTKAFIQKNGEELNSNGNVSSYKDIIFSEFDLDPNFLALSKLSSSDRGLADKLPSERKKFMSSIIDELEAYNSIYKILNKKHSIFKSHLNTLHSKIYGIGDEGVMRAALSSYSAQLTQLNNELDMLKDSISKKRARLEINDPDGKMKERYANAESLANMLYKDQHNAGVVFERTCNRLDLEPDLTKVKAFIEEKESILENNKAEINEVKLEIAVLSSKIGQTQIDLDAKRAKLDSLSTGIDRNIFTKLQESEKELKDVLRFLVNDLGISDPDGVSNDELTLIRDTMADILGLMDRLTYDLDSDTRHLILTKDLMNIMSKLRDTMDRTLGFIESDKAALQEANKDAESMLVLTNRPKGCAIDTCPFISKAYELQTKKYGEKPIHDIIESLTNSLMDNNEMLNAVQRRMDRINTALEKQTILNNIKAIIQRSSTLLSKITIGKILVDSYLDIIKKGLSLNRFKGAEDTLNQAINALQSYGISKKHYDTVLAEYHLQENNLKVIEQYEDDINAAMIVIDNHNNQLKTYNNALSMCTDIVNNLEGRLKLAKECLEQHDTWSKLLAEYTRANAEFEKIKSANKDNIELLASLSDLEAALRDKISISNDLSNKVSSIKAQLYMLDQYKAEYNEYSNKANLIDKIKAYASPTKGGIQALFIEMYMSKATDLANQILGMLFGGEYRLLDFVINADEFRMPFVGSGMVVDDVSSGSTSQICMIGLAVNMAIMYQASTRYNIPRLDELDSGLDNRNKMGYVDVIYRILDILKIQQSFMISHSLELEMSNVDLIRLRSVDDDISTSANVIYDFNSMVKTS